MKLSNSTRQSSIFVNARLCLHGGAWLRGSQRQHNPGIINILCELGTLVRETHESAGMIY